ncbi:MAG: hypothetical protein JXQ65_06490 [Candidatus Marinimicrobia bacterium]|nr:hypothetical protein [Candidatus Neomarinimicrobiota bacterium]
MAKQHKRDEEKKYSQPYDQKLFVNCDSCEGKMLYRKGRMHNEKVYYLICNDCGNYRKITEEEYKQKIMEVTNKSE